MKRLFFFTFIIILGLTVSGCSQKKSDKEILLGETLPRIKEALEKSDGSLYLEQVSADAPHRQEFIEYSIALDEERVPRREIKIGELKFYEEEGREFAKLLVIENEDAVEKICDYIFRKERVSWKLFSRDCE